jgi:hypothetical protein
MGGRLVASVAKINIPVAGEARGGGGSPKHDFNGLETICFLGVVACG